jgi:RNA polymerase sigma-70 factor (ECF subfamily)
MEGLLRPLRQKVDSEMLAGVTTLGVATLPAANGDSSREDIVVACQQGDSEAFAQLFEAHKDRVYSIALRFFGDNATAMDIAQDVFVKLLSRIGEFRGEARFETWLYRMAANACLDHKRRLVRWVPFVSDVVDLMKSKGEGALDGLLREEFQGGVQRAIEKLPAEQRIVVVLRYTEGLSYDDIAEILRISNGTVASRLNRAHKTLERRLAHMRKG